MKTCMSLTLAAATFVLLAVAAPPAFGQEAKPEVKEVSKEYAVDADKVAMKCKEKAAGDEEAAKKCEAMYAEKCEAMAAEYMAMAETQLAEGAEKCEAMAAEGDAEGAEACEAKVAEHTAKLAAYEEEGMSCEMLMRKHEHEHEMEGEKAEHHEKEMKEEAAEDEGDEEG